MQAITLERMQQQIDSKVYGTLIKWKNVQLIGQGSFGEVLNAINVDSASTFVVKRLNIYKPTHSVDLDVIA